MTNLNQFSKTLLSSYLWSLLSKWIVRGLGLISTLILVRLLTPEDFGLIAQAMLVFMLFETLSQTGGNQYIIKLKSISSDQLMSTWTLNLLIRTAFSLLIIIFSKQLSAFFNEDRLTNIFVIYGFILVIQNLNSPKLPILYKELQYKKIAALEVSVKLITFIFTVSLAFYLKNYWVLLISSFISTLSYMFGSFLIAPCIPYICTKHIKEQLGFTRGVLVTSILGYLRSKADIFVVSHKFGTSSTGHYSISQEFAILPLTEVVGPMMGPLFSSFSKISDDNKQLEDKVFKYLSLMYLFLLPATMGMIFLSDQIVLILLGPKWLDSAPILSALAFLMVVFGTNNVFKQVLVLKGFFNGLIAIDILGLTLIALAMFMDNMATPSFFAGYRAMIGAVVICATIFIVHYFLKFDVRKFFICFILPATSSIIMWQVLTLVADSLSALDNIYLYTTTIILAGFLSYTSSTALTLSFLKNKNTIWQFNHSVLIKFIRMYRR